MPGVADDDRDFRLAVAQCQRILAHLSVLGDSAPCSAPLDRRGGSHGAFEGSAPRFTTSLYAHYLPRVRRAIAAHDRLELQHLAVVAERDLQEYKGVYRPPHYEHHDDAVTRLLQDYAGRPALEVAAWLRCPERWVRKQRVLNGRDPDTGERRESDERLDRVVALAKAGKSTRAIAELVGLSYKRVQRALAGE